MSQETNISWGISRRRLLQVTAAGAAVTIAMPNIARSAPRDLVIGVNGGRDYEAMYNAVYAKFEKDNNVRIVPSFGDSSTLLNKVIAEKNAPTMDMVVTYQGGWLIGKAEGVFEKVDYKAIPYIDEIYPFLIDPEGYAPFANMAAWGLVYNRDAVKKPPASIKDLWKPEYAKQFMIGGIYHWQLHLTAAAQAFSGNQNDIDTAFAKFKEVVPQCPGFYGLTSDAQSKFQQGIGDIALWFSFAAQRLRQAGMPLVFRPPEEGAFIYPICYQAVRGTKNLDLVQKLIGAIYEPDACVALARENGFIPANRKVKLDPELQKEIMTYDDVMAANKWDWDFINKNNNAWLNRWNAEVRPLLKA